MGFLNVNLFGLLLRKLEVIFSRGLFINTAGRSFFQLNVLLITGLTLFVSQTGNTKYIEGNCRNGISGTGNSSLNT